MKILSTVLFSVILTCLIFSTSSQPNEPNHDRRFNHYLYRLERIINASSYDVLPFTLTVGLIDNLRWTSDEFKNLCLDYDVKHISKGELLSPVTSLISTIEHIFYYYKESAQNTKGIMIEIEKVDPVGLNVYLTKNNVKNSSPMFMDFVVTFVRTMSERVILARMKTQNSYFSLSSAADYVNIQKLPQAVRDVLSTEYGDTKEFVVDMFTDLVSELRSMTMYPVFSELHEYETHNFSRIDDVQILYGAYFHNTEYWTKINVVYHAICVYYKAETKTVHVYDSAMDYRLSDRQFDIVSKLYPYNEGIFFEKPLALQDHHPTCAIFAMTYATMLLFKKDPAKTNIRLNKVHGDESIYMRKYILNMLATRKLFLME